MLSLIPQSYQRITGNRQNRKSICNSAVTQYGNSYRCFRGGRSHIHTYILPSGRWVEMDYDKLTKLVWHAERALLKEKGLDSFIGWKEVPICPFKGRCYEATVAIYELMDGDGLSLYRVKDPFDEWHWFMVIDRFYQERLSGVDPGDFLVDVTSRQYRHPLIPPTQKVSFGKIGEELNGCEYMKAPLHYPSYKKKVDKFKQSILDHIEMWENRSRHVRVTDFVEGSTVEENVSEIKEKPVTLDEFFT